MRKTLIVLSALLLLSALAQSSVQKRIITITSQGGTQSGNLQYGPIQYANPKPCGIKATVSNLAICAEHAELTAPQGMLLAKAQGQREASFTQNVKVIQDRLTATGPKLVYSETTGLGVLSGPVKIVVAPKKEGDDPVHISSSKATFDVDTDVSVSEGDVTLTSGTQHAKARELTFEENRNLGVLTNKGGQATAERTDKNGKKITITADEIRALTEEDTLLATGHVTLVSGDTTSTGDTVYYNDKTSTAEIIGKPAVSVNKSDGTRITGGRLEQRTDIDAVRVLSSSAPIGFNAEDFALSSEQSK